ncbi:molybdopterin-dependent oxidoreductase [Chloroflexota bacterium]
MKAEAGQKSAIQIRGYCPQCSSCCPTVFHLRDGVLVKVERDKEHPNSRHLCPKGLAAPELVYDKQRLKYPVRRTRPKGDTDPGWERITWDEALDTIAGRMKEIKAKYGAEAVVFNRPGPGGSPSTDYAGWLNRLGHAFGTPNILATGHVCQWHRDTGSTYTYGRGSIGLPEFEKAACIVLLGANPFNTSRTRYEAILEGQKKGAKLIVIDPRRTEMASRADLWLQLRPGTDGALVLSMIHTLIEEELYDKDFTREWTTAPFLVRRDTGDLLQATDLIGEGQPVGCVVWDTQSQSPQVYEPSTRSFKASSVVPALTGQYGVELASGQKVNCDTVFELLSRLASDYPAQKAAEITRVPEEHIQQAARMLSTIKPTCYFTYNGLEQHTNATQTNRAVCTLYALTGNYDAPGGNVIYTHIGNDISGIEFLSPEVRRRRLAAEERPLRPAGGRSVQAYKVWEAIMTGEPYPIKALVAFGGNIVIANSPSAFGREALSNLDFYAQVDLYVTPSAELADIVLPAASCFESWHVRTGFTESAAGYHHLQLREAVVPPQYESRPDMEIMFDLANRLGLSDRFWNGDIEAAFDYQLAPSGITVEELRRKPGGLSIEVPIEYKKYQTKDPKMGRLRGFDTPSGRLELYSQVFKDNGYDPLPAYREPAVSPISRPDLTQKYPLILTCSKLLQFCHSQHRSIPSLRKAVPYPLLEINPERAKALGIEEGEWVVLETFHGSIKLRASLTKKLAYDVVCTQHGWWQSCDELDLPGFSPYSSEGANLNLIYPCDIIDPISGSVPYKAYLCNIRRP